MATRRQFFGPLPTPASPMTPKGGSRSISGDGFDGDNDQSMEMTEAPDTFRRRVTPVVGSPQQKPSSLQEILAMLKGGQ